MRQRKIMKFKKVYISNIISVDTDCNQKKINVKDRNLSIIKFQPNFCLLTRKEKMKNQFLQGGVTITPILLLWNFALLFPNKQSIDSSHHEIPSSLVHKANSLFTLIVHQEDQKKKSNIFQFVEELLFSHPKISDEISVSYITSVRIKYEQYSNINYVHEFL